MLISTGTEVAKPYWFMPPLPEEGSMVEETLASIASCFSSTVLPTRELVQRFNRGDVKTEELEWLRMNHTIGLMITPVMIAAKMVAAFAVGWLLGCGLVIGAATLSPHTALLIAVDTSLISLIAKVVGGLCSLGALAEGSVQIGPHVYGVLNPKYAALHLYKQELAELKKKAGEFLAASLFASFMIGLISLAVILEDHKRHPIRHPYADIWWTVS